MSCHPVYYKEWKEITFGYKFLMYARESKSFHPGTDYNKNQGRGGNGDLNEPARASKRGKTSVVQGGGGYGHQIILEHEDGTFTKYAHLNKIFVKPGQMVEEGEIIGLIGKSGTTSAHLHHEILTNKLVTWLQKTRPYSWWNFYPRGYSKAWIAEHYIDPLKAHTYPPPEEIKKNMNILLICNTTFTPHLLAERVSYVKEFYKTHFKVEINFELKRVNLKEIKWKGNFLEREWLAFNVVPYASGCDGLVLWLDPKDWKPTTKIGDSYPDQILGVHVMTFATTENMQNTRWKVPENSVFTGLLRHELSHMIAQRTGKPSNNTNEWKQGNDNTHHFDFTKKLEQFAPEIDLDNFEGWIPKQGVRLFKYNNPSKLKWAFSGIPVVDKVYKSFDNRMFFVYNNGWRIITEQEFNLAINQGKQWGYMSVPEANKIYSNLGVPVPYSPPHHIMYELVTSTFKEHFLKLLGWSETIPNTHIKD